METRERSGPQIALTAQKSQLPLEKIAHQLPVTESSSLSILNSAALHLYLS